MLGSFTMQKTLVCIERFPLTRTAPSNYIVEMERANYIVKNRFQSLFGLPHSIVIEVDYSLAKENPI